MGEEEKKTEEKKAEEKKPEEAKKPEAEKKVEEKASEEKKEEKKTEESKDSKEAPAPPPPPPPEIVLRVYMHCEGCARKVRRSLKGFEGVEDIQTDCKTHKVVVKGEKADPLKVAERVQRKIHRQVELLSPIPKPPAEDAKKAEEKENVKPEEKKVEVITVVLKVHMHCEGCAQEIKRRIQRMKGVEAVEPDLKSSQVTVKGAFDPATLVEYVYKRTGKQAVIVKQEAEKKEEEKSKEGKEEKKEEKKGEEEKEEKKDGEAVKAEGDEESKVVELKKNEYYYYPSMYATEFYEQHPPQMFSDENPNACSVM